MKTLGIIAGNGYFPLLLAKQARREGYRLVIAGIEKEADPSLAKKADAFDWIKVGALKKLSKFFQGEGVHEAVMAGKIEKVRLFQENVRPDLAMMKILMKARDFKDDSLLGGIAQYLHKEGIDLMDSTALVKDQMPGPGVLGKKKPSKVVQSDMEFGFEMAKKISEADIGQTVVVKKKAVLAVEAIEGTDAAIERGGRLGGDEATVVKVAKPNQDKRFDVPAVGLQTLQGLIAIKAKGFAFEAHQTLFLDQELFVERANQKGIAVVGLL